MVACERRRASLQRQRSATASSLGEAAEIFGTWWEEQREVPGTLWKSISYSVAIGYARGKRTMVAAQYHKPSGIFYGGGAHSGAARWENSVFVARHAIYELGN